MSNNCSTSMFCSVSGDKGAGTIRLHPVSLRCPWRRLCWRRTLSLNDKALLDPEEESYFLSFPLLTTAGPVISRASQSELTYANHWFSTKWLYFSCSQTYVPLNLKTQGDVFLLCDEGREKKSRCDSGTLSETSTRWKRSGFGRGVGTLSSAQDISGLIEKALSKSDNSLGGNKMRPFSNFLRGP